MRCALAILGPVGLPELAVLALLIAGLYKLLRVLGRNLR